MTLPYNGSGGFNVYTPGTPYVTGTIISSTIANNVNSDFATGLSTAICKDGQTTITANIPMGGFKFTGLAAGSSANDSVRVGQLQTQIGVTLIAVAGTNTITASGSPTVTAYATGQFFRFVPAATNTGATTINIDSLGAKNIFKNGAALIAGDITINKFYGIYYDGTQFNILEASDYAKAGVNADLTSTTALTAVTSSAGFSFTTASGITMNRGLAVGTTSGVLQHPDGTVSAPGLRVGSSSATGLFSSADNTLRVSCNGTQVAQYDSSTLWMGATATVAGTTVPVYSATTARAWVKFTTITTTTITSSLNVTSLTDNGTGDTTVNFTSALPSANYVVAGAASGTGGGLSLAQNSTTTPTASACRIYASVSAGSTDCVQFALFLGG